VCVCVFYDVFNYGKNSLSDRLPRAVKESVQRCPESDEISSCAHTTTRYFRRRSHRSVYVSTCAVRPGVIVRKSAPPSARRRHEVSINRPVIDLKTWCFITFDANIPERALLVRWTAVYTRICIYIFTSRINNV